MSPSRKTRFLLAIALAAICAAIVWAVQRYRYRFVRSNADLVRLLPRSDATVFFIDFEALRRSGYLRLLQSTRPEQDKEYARFERETNFDYLKDLDSLAGASDGRQLFFVLRGRFNFGRVRAYVMGHGGTCQESICKISTSTAGKWVSFRSIQPDIIALGISADTAAAEEIGSHANGARSMSSSAPVWIELSHALLANPAQLAPALQIFAGPLQPATSVVLSLNTAGSGAAFDLQLDATYEREAAAEIARNQLEIQTKMFKLELAREHKAPSRADLTGLVTAGNFQLVHNHMLATWPVNRELLASLEH